MRIVSIDIDPQASLNRIHLGPFVAGLNAVFGSRGSGKSTIATFIRQLLYTRHRDRSGSDYRGTNDMVGTLQWADANGNSRVISSSDPSDVNDYRFSGYHHWSSRHDRLFADGSNAHRPSEQPWHRIGGETFDAVFCGRLGETLPERLWAAARELGIAIRFDLEDDETLRRLRAEERRLQERIHHLRVDDRDHAWWTAEHARLAARLEELQAHPELANDFRSTDGRSKFVELDSRPVAKQWRSQLGSLQSQLSTLQREEIEVARQIADMEVDLRSRESSARPYAANKYTANSEHFDAPNFEADSPWNVRRSTQVRNDAYGSWTGYVDRSDTPLSDQIPLTASLNETVYSHGAHASDQSDAINRQLAGLHQHRGRLRNQIANLHRSIRTIEENLRTAHNEIKVDATMSWEFEDLKKRLAYADEVLQSWTLYEQTRARLVEVQSQLRGHGPYRNGSDSSFLNSIERYIRELSAGALRGLPTWSLEALRRDNSYITGLSSNGKPESYREVYRDYRPDAALADFVVPPSTSPERQMVELAIRMAIIDTSAHRIGRLPLLLDDALDGFHGQQLDHIVRVLMQFARDGLQILLLTSEEEVAQRVRAHQGWVARLTDAHKKSSAMHRNDVTQTQTKWVPNYTPAPAVYEPVVSTNYIVQPTQPSASTTQYVHSPVVHEYVEQGYPATTVDLNHVLANEADSFLDVVPSSRPTHPVNYFDPSIAQPNIVRPSSKHTVRIEPTTANLPRQFYLAETSRIEDAPGMINGLATRLRRLGINTVGNLIETDANWIAQSLGQPEIQSAELRNRQCEALLMCCVPQLRAFDARVLVGCGIDNPNTLADMRPAVLLQRVESFLATDRGQEILRSGTSYELSRITTWIVSARRALQNQRDRATVPFVDRGAGLQDRRSDREARLNSQSNARPRSERERLDRELRRSRRALRNGSSNNVGGRYVNQETRIPPVQTTTRTVQRVVEPVARQAFAPAQPAQVRTAQRVATVAPVKTTTTTTTRTTSDRNLKFYLQLDSPVVDAPSIGPRMATQLEPLGIYAVRDLLACNADAISQQLNDKRFDAQTIVDWQDQARLVCTVPNLRGHDAQILVASNVRTADALAMQSVDTLLQKSVAFASSKAGQRLLRGAAAPDQAEVSEWISWAHQSRVIQAA